MFILRWFNNVFGWTTQKSVITGKNFMTSNNLFWNIIKRTSIKYAHPKFQSFINPFPQYTCIRVWKPVPQKRTYDFFYPPTKNKIFLLCFLSENKFFIAFSLFLASQQSRQSRHPLKAGREAQCSRSRICLSTRWGKWFTIVPAKAQLKNVPY